MHAAFALGALVLLSGQAPAEAPDRDLRSLARDLRKSVVELRVAGSQGPGSGTGFFVREDGWVATNEHVIRGATSVTAHLEGGRTVLVDGVLAQSEEHDLALLKLPLEGVSPLVLGDSEKIEQGTEVVLLGNPQGLGLSLSEGIVAAIRPQGLGELADADAWRQRLLQTTAPISPGSSGSPAVTLGREVIGVAIGERTGGQNLNFLIPVERLKELMADVEGGVTELQPVSAVPWVNVIVSAVFFVGLAVAYFFVRRRKAPKGG